MSLKGENEAQRNEYPFQSYYRVNYGNPFFELSKPVVAVTLEIFLSQKKRSSTLEGRIILSQLSINPVKKTYARRSLKHALKLGDNARFRAPG